MNIQPKAGPSVLLPPTATNNANSTARQAAIALLNGAQTSTEPSPVQNANKVFPEEMGAIKSQDSGQNITSEEPKTSKEDTSESSESSLSDKYAMLARREKALRAKAQAQESAIKAREAAIAEREAKLSQPIDESKYVQRDRLAQDPLSALIEAGLTSDQITELLLNAPKADDMSRDKTVLGLKAELQAIRDAQAKAEKANEERTQQSYQQAVNQIRLETKNLVLSDPEFETIKETNSIDDVVDLIQKTFEKDKVLLTVEEAAREVESYLVEEALKVSKINKIRQRLAQASAPKADSSANKPGSQPTGAKTLTNSMNVSRQLSARERAIMAAKGELKG